MDESWYVTPPACFTRASPVHVETSPLEDLLIEHPSMSVYRTAKHPIVPDTSLLTPIAFEEIGESTIHVSASNLPCVFAQSSHKQRGNVSNVVNSPRKREYRMTNNDKNIEIVQLRSAQKVNRYTKIHSSFFFFVIEDKKQNINVDYFADSRETRHSDIEEESSRTRE